jgi:hypothetical protein
MLTLVHNGHPYLSLTNYAVVKEFAQYFNLELYDAQRSYNPRDTFVLSSYINIDKQTWFQPLVQQGSRVIVDHLWDGDVDTLSAVDDAGHLVLRGPNWLWYHCALLWHQQGYDNYQPTPTIKHPFFMPMNRQEWHRDFMVKSLASVLDLALWSYRAQNKELPGDIQEGVAGVPWRAYANPNWYDSTLFSVVAESFMRTKYWASAPTGLNYRTEISEKSFKPICFQHPMIVFGSEGTLRYLRNQGFETFDNMFDESYDDVLDDLARFDSCVSSVLSAVDLYKQGDLVVDAYTQDKLKHNHARFFDLARVRQGIKNQIVKDILEYAQ